MIDTANSRNRNLHPPANLSQHFAYYDYRISSGPLEGTNNKIKTMKRMAYGFIEMEFFKLKIMDLHEAKYALMNP